MKSAEQKAIERLEETERMGFFLGYSLHINSEKMVPTDFEMEFLSNHLLIARIAMWLNMKGAHILQIMNEWLPQWYLYVIWPEMKRQGERREQFLKELRNDTRTKSSIRSGASPSPRHG